MWKILLLGKIGQLGWELQRSLAPLGEMTVLDYPDIDYTNLTSISPLVLSIKPNVIVNAVAYTNVDKAESETDIANAINGYACGEVAKAARQIDAALIHYSTDYVFDGNKGTAYIETDPVNPMSAYGKSKLIGEQAVQEFGNKYLILRTSWVYSMRRDNYVLKVMRWARTNPHMRIVTDQKGSPTSARMLAEISGLALGMAKAAGDQWFEENQGIYHLAGDGGASRFEMAQSILSMDPKKEEQIVEDLQPATSDEFPLPARRPVNTELNCDKFEQTFGLRLPPWEEALRLEMETL